ncbi:hypothetical protein J0J30_22680, partial [Vibrio vulnificus]|nr:hypothetical protein [Vibrio vulnificus]
MIAPISLCALIPFLLHSRALQKYLVPCVCSVIASPPRFFFGKTSSDPKLSAAAVPARAVQEKRREQKRKEKKKRSETKRNEKKKRNETKRKE